ncbi:hypothetical protein Tco_0482118, partial [Tanacetum coccineum]
KEIVDITAQTPSAYTIVPGIFKLDLGPLAPRLLQNREAHIEYLKYTQEQADILRGIVEQAKAKKPLDKELDFSLLKCSTSNCGSKPTGNKKNDMISRTPRKNMKNKVEAKPRKVNKKNSVVEPIRDVDVKHSLINANSEPICATCKKSMFDGVHDMCLLDFVENVNSHAKSAKKHKKQNIWKPTGHVFTEVGFKRKPTCRTFTIVGNSCPLTRITSANIVPPKKSTSYSVETQKPELKVYSRKPKNVGCPDCSLAQLDSGTAILQGLWGMVTINWEMLLFQEYTTIMDPNTSIGRLCLGEDNHVSLNDDIESNGEWDTSEYYDTADSGKKKELKSFTFYRMETKEATVSVHKSSIRFTINKKKVYLGIIYVDLYKRKRLMRVDELYKFSDGTLNDVRSALHDIAEGIRIQNWRDLPRDIPLDSVVVLRYEKRSKSENKGKVPTEMELVLEQTQQGISYEVSVSAEGVEELKRKVKIKGEKKEALLTLRYSQWWQQLDVDKSDS